MRLVVFGVDWFNVAMRSLANGDRGEDATGHLEVYKKDDENLFVQMCDVCTRWRMIYLKTCTQGSKYNCFFDEYVPWDHVRETHSFQ